MICALYLNYLQYHSLEHVAILPGKLHMSFSRSNEDLQQVLEVTGP